MASFSVYKDTAGEWRWTLLADNNRKIANSGEGYRNREDCLSAIELVRRDAATASVDQSS